MTMSRAPFARTAVVMLAVVLSLLLPAAPLRAEPLIIAILADHDSRYKIAGMKSPAITLHAGDEVHFRITARKAESWNRDGTIHGFTLLRAKDRSKVAGWDFLLRPGTQEIVATAPAEPGDYEVVCMVICSSEHEGMHMKFTVLP